MEEKNEKQQGLSWEGNLDKKTEPKTETEELWSSFKTYFWIIFVVKLIATYGIAKSDAWTDFVLSLNLGGAGSVIVNLLIQFIPVAAMVFVMGYYAYKISGNKLKMWKGLWGLLWFGVIAIFIGYYAVKREKDSKIKEQ